MIGFVVLIYGFKGKWWWIFRLGLWENYDIMNGGRNGKFYEVMSIRFFVILNIYYIFYFGSLIGWNRKL